MNYLVAGGAGYIGSHMVKLLAEAGHQVWVLDNLSTGHRWAVDPARCTECDLLDAAALDQLFAVQRFDAVLHFAASSLVGESIADPGKYYRNNVAATVSLLEAMRRHSVDQLVFSSTAAIFGEPRYSPIDEAHPKAPINPYGRSKWMIEQILDDYAQAHDLRSVCLRYFNAAGAWPDGSIGEAHSPETHLIPLAIGAALGQRPPLTLFGDDYPTHDGTCIRDYIHVVDLSSAHLLALQHLQQGGGSRQFNLGNGTGYSVLDVITAVEQVCARKVPMVRGARRSGDPATLVADARQIQSEWGWQTRYPDLHSMVEHALRFCQRADSRS